MFWNYVNVNGSFIMPQPVLLCSLKYMKRYVPLPCHSYHSIKFMYIQAAKEKEVTPSEAADAKIKDDVEEFFNVKNLDKAEVYFSTLHSQYHHSLVNRLTSSAVESKEPDAKLVADLFTRAKSKGLCSPDAFEEGLTPTAEMIEDIVIDAPKAWTLFATMVNGAELDEEHRTRLASKSTDSNKLLGLLLS